MMVSGAQGCGKTTALLGVQQQADARIALLSLDDFYLPKAERQKLAAEVHPLLETRGPPGTHDIARLAGSIRALREAGPTAATTWPVFDKRADDHAPASLVHRFEGAPDIIIVEGWLLGALADPAAPMTPPMNALERAHDADGAWRAFQERQLATLYEPLWREADVLVHVLAPDFDVVGRWRLEQEATTFGVAIDRLPSDRKLWVSTFVQYYERITRRMIAGARADGTGVKLDAQRRVV